MVLSFFSTLQHCIQKREAKLEEGVCTSKITVIKNLYQKFLCHVQIKERHVYCFFASWSEYSIHPSATGLISLIKYQAITCFPEQSNQLLQVGDFALMK